MHTGVADAAERDQVCRIIVCGVAVDMVDMKVLSPAADGTPVPVAFKDSIADLLPSPQGIFVPRQDGGREPFTVNPAFASGGKRAPAAEPAETVPVGMVAAEGSLRTVERVQAQLKVSAHGQKRVGFRTG